MCYSVPPDRARLDEGVSAPPLAQALVRITLTILVLVFIWALISKGYSPHVAVLTAGGGVAVAGGLSSATAGLKRWIAAWGQS